MAHNRKLSEHYRTALGRYRLQSPILNPQGFGVDGVALQMSYKTGLKNLLVELEGQEDGRWLNQMYGGRWFDCKLRTANLAVEAIEQEFERVKAEATRNGHSVPTEMPEEMLERYHEALAKLDCVKEEIDKLRDALAKIEAREAIEDNDLVLKDGAIGTGKLLDGILSRIDGQKVSINDDNVLVIRDERSPYNGMRVVDYREHIVKPYVTELRRLRAEDREQARKEERPLKHPRPPLPEWPDAVPNPNHQEQSKPRRVRRR